MCVVWCRWSRLRVGGGAVTKGGPHKRNGLLGPTRMRGVGVWHPGGALQCGANTIFCNRDHA